MPEPPQTAERDVNKSYSNTPLPAIVIGYKIPARYKPDAYPLDLASNILAGGESSRLYQALVYKDRIAVQAGGFGNFSEDPNLFWAYAIMNQGHTADEGEKAMVDVLDGLKEAPVDARELEKAKNQEISGFILGRDTDEEKAVALASAAVIGKDPGLVNTELDHYLKVSPADIQRVAHGIFCSATRHGSDRYSRRARAATTAAWQQRQGKIDETLSRYLNRIFWRRSWGLRARRSRSRTRRHRAKEEPENSAETRQTKNGTGVVPPGVKLESQMPGGGRAESISLSESRDERRSRMACGFSWSAIMSNPQSRCSL